MSVHEATPATALPRMRVRWRRCALCDAGLCTPTMRQAINDALTERAERVTKRQRRTER